MSFVIRSTCRYKIVTQREHRFPWDSTRFQHNAGRKHTTSIPLLCTWQLVFRHCHVFFNILWCCFYMYSYIRVNNHSDMSYLGSSLHLKQRHIYIRALYIMCIFLSDDIVGQAQTPGKWVSLQGGYWQEMTAKQWHAQCNSALLWCVGETGSGPSSRNASVERGGERQSDTSDSETTDVRRINQQPFNREGRYDPNRWVSNASCRLVGRLLY